VRRLWAVSPDEVQDLARRFLRPEAAALALVGPKGGGFQEMGRAALGVADA
jgi:predicted Zn-dependent peptidase